MNVIMQFSGKEIPLSKFLESYPFIKDNGLYTLTVFAGENEYQLNIVPNGYGLENTIDYSKVKFTVNRESDHAEMTNPNNSEINGFVVLPYLDYVSESQKDALKDEKAYAVYFNQMRKEEYIKLSTELVSDIEFMLAMSNVQCVDYDDVEDTDDYFFATDIRIHLKGGDAEMIEFKIMMNEKGNVGIMQRGDGMIFMHQDICERVMKEVKANTDWNYICKSKLTNIEKAEFLTDNELVSAISSQKDLNDLEKILSRMKCIGSTPKTVQQYSKLIVTVDGEDITMDLGVGDKLIQLGSSF